jgi:hypothetical protein
MADDDSDFVEFPLPYTSKAHLQLYVAGLLGLAFGAGFYGILCCLMIIAWSMHAPNAPSIVDGAVTLGAAMVHLFPLICWLAYREELWRQSARNLRGLAVAAWLLIPASLAVIFATLGFE